MYSYDMSGDNEMELQEEEDRREERYQRLLKDEQKAKFNRVFKQMMEENPMKNEINGLPTTQLLLNGEVSEYIVDAAKITIEKKCEETNWAYAGSYTDENGMKYTFENDCGGPVWISEKVKDIQYWKDSVDIDISDDLWEAIYEENQLNKKNTSSSRAQEMEEVCKFLEEDQDEFFN